MGKLYHIGVSRYFILQIGNRKVQSSNNGTRASGRFYVPIIQILTIKTILRYI